MKFYILSTYGELLDVGMALKDEGHEVVLGITDPASFKIGDGILKKDPHWFEYLGKEYIFIVDGTENSNIQEYLRSRGEAVFGNGGPSSAKLENDREAGQAWFKAAGFKQPMSRHFDTFPEAIRFVTDHPERRCVMKQNGNAPKSLNHIGKFEGNIDMLYHLSTMEKRWNRTEYGEVDFDLMEFVEGMEVAVSAFFNGTDFVKNSQGKIAAFVNWEEKKEIDGNLGDTTGEMGTTFLGADEDNPIVKEVLLKPKIAEVLRKLNYRGVFDINGCMTKDGYIAFEPTCRPGIPASSYEFIHGLETPIGEMFETVAKGLNRPVNVKKGIGMVMVVASRPYPVEYDLDDEATSSGERLWLLKDGKPVDGMTADHKNIHLQNFYKDEEGNYRVATKNGYLLTVTGTGPTIEKTRDDLIVYIKSHLYIAGNKWRSDIGKRVEDYFGVSSVDKVKREYEQKLADAKKKVEEEAKEEMTKLKSFLKDAIYG